MMHHNRFKRATMFALTATLSLLGLASVTTTAHADSFKTLSKYSYVKTTRAVYTGQYTLVNGKKGHKIITPKGTILKISGSGASRHSDGSLSYTMGFTRGDLHYNAGKKIYQTSRQIAFNPNAFKGYKLKMPVRTKLLQSGTGYPGDTAARTYNPIFHVTLDGYIEYYSAARLKHYGVYNGSNASFVTDDLNKIKPTTSVKLSTFKVKGNTAYLYYKTPISGLNAKKVSSRYYRLTIKKTTNTIEKTWHYSEDFTDVQWVRYSVGGHVFYNIIDIARGD